MHRVIWIGFAVLMLMAVASGFSRKIESITIHVKETAGIRRNVFPAHAAVSILRGAMTDAAQGRLTLNQKEVPAQFTVASKWPDGSTQSLDVDWNASVGPMESATFQLEVGEGVNSEAATGGLTVLETADVIQVGSVTGRGGAVKFSKTGVPLLTSVNYRQEDIGPGPNGFAITDASGASYDLSQAENVKAEVLKRGPLFVVIRYSGQIRVATDTRVPFTIQVEMPNSKTWWKATASFDDAGKRVRTITFNSPLVLGAYPWVWDFGTGSWSYGAFRNKTDSVVLTQTVAPHKGAPHDGSWQIATGMKGQEQPYEKSAGRRPTMAEGWGHIQDAKEAIAFAVEGFGKDPGVYAMSLDGEGNTAIQFVPAKPANRLQLAIYQHFVAMPVPIGAVTSPVSMLSPLEVTVAKAR